MHTRAGGVPVLPHPADPLHPAPGWSPCSISVSPSQMPSSIGARWELGGREGKRSSEGKGGGHEGVGTAPEKDRLTGQQDSRLRRARRRLPCRRRESPRRGEQEVSTWSKRQLGCSLAGCVLHCVPCHWWEGLPRENCRFRGGCSTRMASELPPCGVSAEIPCTGEPSYR